MKKCITCGNSGQTPYYESVSDETVQDHASIFNDTRYAAGVVVKEEFLIPAVGSDIQVYLKNVTDVVVNSYLWHPAYGSLKIVYWDGCSKKAGLLNEGLDGTAAAGTVVPECTAFVPSSRPCCADQDNFSLFPFLAENFEAPAVSGSRTIQVTSTFGLVADTNIRIGTGVYYLDQINSSLEIVITNEGAGVTPGTTVEAKDANGDFQYLITTIIITACSATTVTEGRIVVCDGADEHILEGVYAGSMLVLQDATTDEVAFQLMDVGIRTCTALTAQMTITSADPTYTIDVDDESVFNIGDILQINFTALRWEVTDNTTPGELDVTCTIGNPGVNVNYASGSAVCLQLTSDTVIELQTDVTQLRIEVDTGWIDLADSGTYVSVSSFQIAGDVSSYLRLGQKLKFFNPGEFYGNISYFDYNVTNPGFTSINVIVNTDYTIANLAITDIQISYETPPDFPDYFNYTPLNVLGFSAVTTNTAVYTCCEGKVHVQGRLVGTSNATFITLDAPTRVAAASAGLVGTTGINVDNGVDLDTVGMVIATSGLHYMSLFKDGDAAVANWTNSGSKQCRYKYDYFIN
jgi:hypothetical protein